jgi:hypothetical protein
MLEDMAGTENCWLLSKVFLDKLWLHVVSIAKGSRLVHTVYL